MQGLTPFRNLSDNPSTAIHALEQEIASLKIQLANAKAASEKQLSDAKYNAELKVISPFLDVRDSLALACALTPSDYRQRRRPPTVVRGRHYSALADAADASLDLIDSALARLGVSKVSCDPGVPFSASTMEAVSRAPAPAPAAAGTVQSCLRDGFVRGARLLRPARVSVYKVE